MSTKKNESQPSIQRIAELQQLIADFSKVLRLPNFADTGRRENDVEHSYGLALTCWFLAPKIAPELDLGKILRYALAHDLVELHAGDTIPWGPQELIDNKETREEAALKQLTQEWPDFKDLTNTLHAYEAKAEEEARFVYAVDKILPVIIVNLGEKEAYWHRHKVTLEKMKDLKRDKIRLSKHFAPYYEELIEWMTNPDYFYKNSAANKKAGKSGRN